MIEDPGEIADLVNTEVRKEWELDITVMPNDPAAGDSASVRIRR